MTFRRREDGLDREVEDYLERETAENIARGMTPAEARDAARRKLGNATRVKEDTRASWVPVWTWFERLFQDLRQARRMLVKNPGFTAVAVLSLAIGVGANCAIFSLADMMLLRPLPVPKPGDVVALGSHSVGQVYDMLQASYPDYEHLRDNNRSFAGVEAHTFSRVRFAKSADGLPDLKMAMSVSANFFDVLDVRPELGRGFRPEEGQVPGRDAVMVLSHSFWTQEFAGDPGVIGRRVRINDIEFTVIGVAPERFTSVDQWVHPTFYLPAMMQPRLVSEPNNPDPMGPLGRRQARYWTLKARLKPGVAMEEARAEVEAMGAVLAEAYPAANKNFAMTVRTETEARALISQGLDRLVPMLMVLAGAVLLVACANVAGLLTSRAPARAREIAVRMAVGAGRLRLVRQLLTESVLLAVAGGVAGAGVGYAGIALLDRFTYVSDIPVIFSIRMDQRTLLFGIAASALSVFLFGLLPAFRASRVDLVSDLKGSAAKPRGQRAWGRNILVSGQVAVALVLLAVSSFMYLGFRAQLQRGPGFRTNHLLMLEFDPALVAYSAEETRIFYDDLTDRVRELPGVRSAALASFLPLTAEWRTERIVPEGFELPEDNESVGVLSSLGDESYFDTLGMPILEGRGFRASDDAGSARVAVVNETLAALYWPRGGAVGRRFRLRDPDGPWVEIVGVVRNAKYANLGEAPTGFLVLPYAQNPRNDMILMVESAGDPAQLAAPVRQVVRAIDPEQPVFEVRTMEAFFGDGQVTNSVVIVQSVGAMGLMGIALALTGLYGLVAFTVNTRTREIGIRMALGAARADVLRMVLRQGMTLALAGVTAGVVLSAIASRLMASVFVSEGGSNLAAYAIVVPAVLAVTLAAAYVPARRASRIDPVRVLRYE